MKELCRTRALTAGLDPSWVDSAMDKHGAPAAYIAADLADLGFDAKAVIDQAGAAGARQLLDTIHLTIGSGGDLHQVHFEKIAEPCRAAFEAWYEKRYGIALHLTLDKSGVPTLDRPVCPRVKKLIEQGGTLDKGGTLCGTPQGVSPSTPSTPSQGPGRATPTS